MAKAMALRAVNAPATACALTAPEWGAKRARETRIRKQRAPRLDGAEVQAWS